MHSETLRDELAEMQRCHVAELLVMQVRGCARVAFLQCRTAV